MGHFMALSDDRKTLVWQIARDDAGVGRSDQENPAQALSGPSRYLCRGDLTRRQTGRVSPRRAAPRGAALGLGRRQTGGRAARFRGPRLRMAFSPNGKLLATGDEFGTIRLFDVATNKEVASLKGHGGVIRALVFAPDGRWLYSAGLDGSIRRWKPIPDPDPDQIDGDVDFYPVTVGVSPDGRSFFTYSGFKRGDDLGSHSPRLRQRP